MGEVLAQTSGPEVRSHLAAEGDRSPVRTLRGFPARGKYLVSARLRHHQGQPVIRILHTRSPGEPCVQAVVPTQRQELVVRHNRPGRNDNRSLSPVSCQSPFDEINGARWMHAQHALRWTESRRRYKSRFRAQPISSDLNRIRSTGTTDGRVEVATSTRDAFEQEAASTVPHKSSDQLVARMMCLPPHAIDRQRATGHIRRNGTRLGRYTGARCQVQASSLHRDLRLPIGFG